VSALTTLAGSLAGGLAGGNAASALTGGQGAKNEVENNYLTFAQTMQRDRELAACRGAFACESKIKLKYALLDKQQDLGVLVGVGGGIGLQSYKQAEAVVDMVANLPDTLKALKAIVSDPDFRSKVGDSIAQEYRQRIDTLTNAYNDGGWDGSVTAGVEAGRLAVDIVGTATVAVGAGKVAIAAGKAGVNVATQAITKTAVLAEVSAIDAAGKVGASAASTGRGGTVFDSIKATQPVMPGTSIPKSFELTVNGEVFWVNPNATKHMAEYLTRNGLSHSTSDGSQAMLTSLQSAIGNASSQGIKFNEAMQIGRWELVFSRRPTGPYPVLKHALYK
jgi:hypothetical protein